ncbi:hypothetical protein [Streptomyces sp. SAI-229]|jgi:hypothetical protein|uniref:hypothetical protein n=1 Tax=Streptomyces sp. SAI-229 TaxID=3377731 RepID=UPI003C7E1C51
MPGLVRIDLTHCYALEDCAALFELPSLKTVRVPSRMTLRTRQGPPHPLVAELTARGVTVPKP